MARKYKETTELVDTPDYNPDGGFPDERAMTSKNKPQPGASLKEFAEGSGTQSGAHSAKTQPRTMRYF